MKHPLSWSGLGVIVAQKIEVKHAGTNLGLNPLVVRSAPLLVRISEEALSSNDEFCGIGYAQLSLFWSFFEVDVSLVDLPNSAPEQE